MKTLIFLITLLSLPLNATVYIVAYDEASGAMGQAVASSGPAYVESSRFQIHEHGLGLVGAGGLGLCGGANARKLLTKHLTASEIVDIISKKCDRAKPYYRLAVVTSHGEIKLHLGPQGCNSHNHNCGSLQSPHLGVIGGGLKAGVLQATFDHFQSLDPSLPLECKLLSTLRKTFASGGEFKNFKVANIVVSYPGRSKVNVWQSKGAESGLLSKLAGKVGQHCN